MLLFAKKNFHGRTTGIVSASTDPSARGGAWLACQSTPPRRVHALPDQPGPGLLATIVRHHRAGFGPFLPNIHTVEYNDLDALEAALEVTYGRASLRTSSLVLRS